jgi:hypothetical protein
VIPTPSAIDRSVPALRHDAGCCQDLNWRCDLPVDLDPERVEEGLQGRGYVVRCRHAALRVLRHPQGHEMAWVLTSGRVQIRVSLTVEKSAREGVARQLYGELVDTLGGSP